MAIVKLTPTDVSNFLKAAYKLSTGTYDATTFNLSQIVDKGSADLDNWRDMFTGKLMGLLAKNWYTFTSYREQYDDKFYIDSREFGAVLQAISIDAPDVKSNSAFTSLVSGTTTLGTYTLYLPVVDTKYYVKQSSWAVPLSISGSQMKTAFEDESSMSEFVSMCFLAVDNAIIQYLENMNMLNRNNFIGEKNEANNAIYNLGSSFLSDVPSSELQEKIATWAETASTGDTLTINRNELITNKEFLRYATRKMRTLKGFMKRQTKLFNTGSKVRFTPDDRLVIQLHQDFVNNAESILQSDTFHEEMVAPEYTQVVPFWQRCNALDFNTTAQIQYVNSSNSTKQMYGVIGFMCDKWAIMHTIVSERVGVQRFDIEDVTHYEHQFCDKYANDLSQNAIVFTCNTLTVTKTADSYTVA